MIITTQIWDSEGKEGKNIYSLHAKLELKIYFVEEAIYKWWLNRILVGITA